MKGGLYNPDPSVVNLGLVSNKDRYDALQCFLQTLDTVYPQVTAELKEIAPLYTYSIVNRVAFERQKHCGDAFSERLPRWTIISSATNDQECTDLMRAVSEWATRYHLTDENMMYTYFIELALMWMHIYNQQEDQTKPFPLLEALFYDSSLSSVALADSSYENKYHENVFTTNFPFIFVPLSQQYYFAVDEKGELLRDEEGSLLPPPCEEYEGAIKGYPEVNGYERSGLPVKAAWNPDEQPTWSEFEKEMLRQFQSYLRAYRARTEEFLKTRGYVKGKRKSEKSQRKHFEWFVRYQVMEWSVKRIHDNVKNVDDECSLENIERRISEVSSLLGLPLRAGKAGPKRAIRI